MADEIRRETTTAGTTPPAYAGGPYGGPYTGGYAPYGGGPYGGTSNYPAVSPQRVPIFRRVSWGAIFAGTFVALAVSVLLWLLGAAVGLAAFDPGTAPGEGTLWGLGIWGIVVTMISLFCGGVVAAWLAAFPKWMDAMLHGLVVWGLTTTAAIGFTAVTGATIFAGGMAAMGDQVGMGPQQQGIFATGDMWRREDPRGTVRDELKSILPSDDDWFRWGRSRTREYTERDIDMLVQQLERGQRQQVYDVLIRDGDMDEQMAQQHIRSWERILQEPREQRTRDQQRLYGTQERGTEQAPAVTPREATTAAAAAATWAFFALLLGAAAAAVGGAIGRPQYMEDRIIQGGHPRYTPPGYQHTAEHRGSEYRGGEYRGSEGHYQPPPSY
jgi:hypothetical protein